MKDKNPNEGPVVTSDEEDFDTNSTSNNTDYHYYNYIGNSKYLPINKIEIHEKLPPGIYRCVFDKMAGETVLKREFLCADKIYDLPIKNLQLIKNDILTFWDKRKKFEDYGLIHKRGILLYGPPGCGKSCAIDMIIDDIITNQNGLVYKISDSDDLQNFERNFIAKVRIIEPERKIFCIIEDIDGLFEGSKSVQTRLLNLLDGINQTNHIVYMATTNYPENLEERILNRPSRFDKRYEFGLPDYETRYAYLNKALRKEDCKNIQIWADETDGLTIAHLRELIVSVIILGNDKDEELKTLHGMKELPTSIKSNKVGFGQGNGKYVHR